jgi:hypothetical protein
MRSLWLIVCIDVPVVVIGQVNAAWQNLLLHMALYDRAARAMAKACISFGLMCSNHETQLSKWAESSESLIPERKIRAL